LIKEDAEGRVHYTGNREACKFFDTSSGKLKEPQEIQQRFIKKTEDFVAAVLGTKYRDVVFMCLRCLDGGFSDVSTLIEGEGTVVGLVYIERVLSTLDEIAV
jgi:hypothetical protein